MIDPKLLGEIIRKHRRVAGLSQIGLAELAGVGKTVVFDIEKGKETIQVDTLRKIFRALNIEVKLASPIMNQLMKDEKSEGVY